MITARENTDIKRIMIHHTETDFGLNGLDVNNLFVRNQQFGAPYDILINYDGKIDATCRWVYGVKPENFYENINIQTIAKRYTKHLLSDAGDNLESNKHDIHIAVVGNFDTIVPSNFQLSNLQQLLEVLQRDITTITDVIYHDDESTTTCPGRMFFNKSTLNISDPFTKDYIAPETVMLIPEQAFRFSIESSVTNKVEFPVPPPPEVVEHENILKIDSENFLLIDDTHFLMLSPKTYT